MHSNRYTFLYAIGISILTAAVLTVSSEGFKPLQEANIALEKKTNILRAVRIDTKVRAEIEKLYAERIKEMVVDGQGNELTDASPADVILKDEVAKPAAERKLPLYLYTDEGGKQYYILPMQGVGLWGPVWGYMSLADDFDTVYGTFFDHKGETPGLGAEIAEKSFQKQFEAKKIMAAGQYAGVRVLKKTAPAEVGPEHRVDGISGGTITSNGVDHMIQNCVQAYLPYFQKIKK